MPDSVSNESNLKPPLGLGLNDYLVLIAFVYLVIRGFVTFLADPGTGWHLQLGKYIFHNLDFPNTDTRVFSAAHSEWILDQWLGDIIMYFFAGKQLALLYVVFGCLFVWLIYSLIYNNLKKLNCSLLLTALACLYVNIFLGIHFLARPVFLSFILFVLFFLLLGGLQKKEGIEVKDYLYAGLISISWANIHSSFLLIYLLIFVSLVSQLKNNNLHALIKDYLYLGLVVVIATLINPDHFQLYYHQVDLTITQLINPSYTEWAQYEFEGVTKVLFFTPLLFCLLTILLNLSFFCQRKFLLISALIFSVLGYLSTRFLVYYAIVISPILLLSLQIWITKIGQILKKTSSGEFLAERFENIELMEQGSGQGKFVLIILTVVFITYAVTTNKVLIYSQINTEALEPKTRLYPKKAITYLNNLPDREVRVFNTTNSGGFLNGYAKPNIRYFIDDRTSFHGQGRYQYVDNWLKPESFLALSRLYQIDYFLIENNKIYQEIIKHMLVKFSDKIVFSDPSYIMIKMQ